MQRIIYRLLCIYILLGSFLSVKAIDERYTARELSGNSLAKDSTSLVLDEVYFNPQLKPLQTTWFVKNLITFKINEDYRHVLPDEFIVNLTFRIRYTEDNNGTPVVSESDPKTLNIEYTKYTSYKNKEVFIGSNWYKVEIIIDSIWATEGNLNDFREALVLTNEILINREYDFSCTNNAIQIVSGSDSVLIKNGEYHVSWAPERAADEYDLEWTYIDSTAISNYNTGNQSGINAIFRNNATRVSITTEMYSIPMLYDSSGCLFYRVRAVQVKRNGQRIESVWSSAYSGGLGQHYFKGLDPKLNWQASTSFAEEGKRKSVVQYFDGSLKSRQTVTKDNTTDTTIIAETLYDHQGRPAIQVMPTPSLSSIINYTPGFNRLNAPQSEYTKETYDGYLQDTCNCKVGAPAMDTSNGAAKYYSPANPLVTKDYHKYIPDAKGYVFAETKYTPDNTGRISVQSGVGETFQIGKRHETSYTYNKADQEELDALFGTEVGNAGHYFKNTVQDANGQVSVSYVDMHGRTIATALTAQPAVSVDKLASNQPNYILKNLIDSTSNVIKGMVIENSNGLYVSSAGIHVFKYSLIPDSIRIKACDSGNVCYDCVYDLRITITEDCNDSTLNGQAPIVITRSNQIDTACGTVNVFPAVEDSVYLRQGSYVITKTLTINQQAMDYYRSVFLAKNTCTSLEQTIQQQKAALLSIIECEPACASCRSGLGDMETFRQNYMQQAGIPAGDTAGYRAQAQRAYHQQLEECNKLCDNSGLHQSIRRQMLADVTPPFGQYANPDNITMFSIFAPKSDGPGYTKVYPYIDENGNEEPVSPHLLSQEEFIEQFKSSWAESLLKEHPEYKKLEKYEQLAESNVWDEHFANTQSFQAAVDSGFLNPGNFSSRPSGNIFNHNSAHRDPFFTDYISNGKIGGDYKTRMQDSLTRKTQDDNNDAVSMWSLATIMAHCPGGSFDCFNRYKSSDSAFAIGSECSGDLDIAWQYFREMYLQEKREIIELVLNQEWRQHPYYQDSLLLLVAKGHKPNFIDPFMPLPETMAADSSSARDSLQLFINDNCAGYATQWMNELGGCYDSDARAWIIPRLIEVCREGGDEHHLFGASTVKPSSTYQYRSFEEVIKAYRDLNGNPLPYNSSCNVYLITAPGPYDQQPVYYDKPVFQKPDSCECATIGTLYQQYQIAAKDSTFADYIYRTTGTRMYQGVLDTLRMACNGQINCSFLKEPLSLPPVLQCGGQNVCVDCDKVGTLYGNYIDQFPDAKPVANSDDSLQVKKNELFERFMNTKLGFTKTTGEYLAFMDTCRIDHSVDCDSLRYILNSFNAIYKDSSMWKPGGQYDGDTTDWVIWSNFPVSWAESFQNGILTFPQRVIQDTNAGAIEYYYLTPLQIPENGLSIETRLKFPVLDSTNCNLPNFQFQLRPGGGFVNAMFFTKSIPCGRTFGRFDLADSTHPGHIYTSHNELAIDMTDWVKIRMTVLKNKYQIYVADTFLMEMPYTGTLTKMDRFGLFFGTDPWYSRAIPAVDYIRVYNGCGELMMNQEFNSVTDTVCPDLSVRVAPDDYKTVFTNYYNQFRNTNFSVAQVDSIYANSCNGIQQKNCDQKSACDTLTKWMNDYKKYGGVPHLDASGSDTTHWKVDFGGWNYTAEVPLGEVIRNGVMALPDYYADTLSKTFVAFDYIKDTICFDTTGFTWESRIKLPDSLANIDAFGTIWWVYLYPNKEVGDILLTISPYDGQGTGVCTHLNDPLKSCILQNAGLHLNDWTVVKLQFRGRNFKVYIDGVLKSERTLDAPISNLYTASIAPRSLKGQVDYIRIYDVDSTMLYNEDFDDAHKLAQISNKGKCAPCEVRFANYFNERNSSNYTYASIDSIYFNGCGAHLSLCGEPALTLCGKTEPVFAAVTPRQHTTCADSTLFSNSTGTLIHDAYRDSLIGSFNDRYLAKCLKARYNETFTLYQPVSEYHYTLYYYDQAGNLVKTIPPEGVDVSKFGHARAWSDSVRTAHRRNEALTPQHKLPTQYRYNTLNQVMAQKSPDGGLSEFWYDRLGRLAISRNAKQRLASATEENRLYSYTKYDSLGRITEVGQVSNTATNGAMTDAVSRNQPVLENWLAALYSRRGQITNTVYDLPYPGFVNFGDPRRVITQRNLRNRVSYTTLTDTGLYNIPSQGTFYTYDILGNVDHLLQDYGDDGNNITSNVMNENGNRWKKISYQYDLISGKVNMVMFQQGWRDGFFHRYSYDAENRLTLVETSKDSLVWEKDARYEYYRHGPLARVTLGDQQVQGIDYAYTLQGWLKGINSTGGSETFDMGEDGKTGSLNQFTARDALGLTLNYFGNDYTAISGGAPFPGYSSKLPVNEFRPLYNGNISSSSVYQRKFEGEVGGPLIFYNYKYDQLNRLTQQDAFTGFDAVANQWNSPMTSMGDRLKERIAYDANGNILKYLRNSINPQARMDSLTYHYYANTNQLRWIKDTVGADGFIHPENRIIDIDGQVDDNYIYDSIGNLVADKQENITSIKWNVYGKIAEITRTATATVPASNIKYTYDAMGNRISQVMTADGTKTYTWYVRDAQGNILTTYSAEGANTDLGTLDFKLSDRFLYGSSRLGTIAANESANGEPGSTEFYYENRKFPYERGYKQYELTNHLGNVLATISDRKFGVSSGGSSLIDHYDPHIVTAQDYYPFGMLSRVALPNSGKDYKFGFNGKLNDNDVKGGLGNQQDYGMRIYDPRVGRFLSVDPLVNSYPWNSPYGYSEGDPINYVDIDGAEKGSSTAQAARVQTKVSIDPGIIKPNWNDVGGNVMPRGGFKPVSSGPVNAGHYTAPSWLGKTDLNMFIPPYAQTAQVVQTPHGVYMVGKTTNGTNYVIPIDEAPEKRELTWVDRLTVGLMQQKINASLFPQQITTTPSDLSDQYLAEVEKRLYDNTATDQDRLYLNEIRNRKNGIGQGKNEVEDGFTRVGRWMSEEEYESMKSSGRVQEGAGGQTFISVLGWQDYRKPTKRGNVYAEFDVPTNSLVGGGKIGWFKLLSPKAMGSQQYTLKKQGGQHLPAVKNISEILHRKD